MALIRAWNKHSKQWQTVPESYVTSKRFDGAFVYAKDAPGTARPTKNSRRKAGTAEINQAADEATPTTEQAPSAGDHNKE